MNAAREEGLIENLIHQSHAPTLAIRQDQDRPPLKNDAFRTTFCSDQTGYEALLTHIHMDAPPPHYDVASSVDGYTYRFLIEHIILSDARWVIAKGIPLPRANSPSYEGLKNTELELLERGKAYLARAQKLGRLGLFCDDFDKGVFYASDKWHELTGFPKPASPRPYEDVAREILSGEQLEGSLQRRREAMRTGGYYRHRHASVGKDETAHTLISDIQTEVDETGRPTCIFGLTMEIPELQDLERQLHHEREVFTQAQHIARVGHIHDNISEGYWHASDTFFELIGRPPHHGPIKYGSDLDLEITGSHRERLDAMRESFRKGIIPSRFQYETKRVDDRQPVWFEVSSYPEHDVNGEVVGYFTIVVDITGSQLLRQGLEEERNLHIAAQKLAKLGHFVLDPKTMQVRVSHVLLELAGIDPQNSPKTYQEMVNVLVNQEQADQSSKRLEEFLKNLQPYEADMQIKRADTGEERTMQMHVEPKMNVRGKLAQIFGTIRDVTDERRLAKELELERDRFERAQRLGKIGHAVDSLAQRTFSASGVLWELLGMEPPPTKLSYEELAPHLFPPDVVEESLNRRAHAAKIGEPYKFELSTTRRDNGEPVIFAVENYPQKDEKGNVTEFFSVVADVTEERVLEASLRDERQIYARAQELAMIGHYIHDLRDDSFIGSDMLWEMSGISPDDPRPQTYDTFIDHFLSPTDRRLTHLRREKALRDGQPYKRRIPVRSLKDGEIRHYWAEVYPETDKQGNVIRFFGIIQDVTDRVQSEEAKEQLELALTEAQKLEALNYFAGGMAHELSNLLQPALNFGALAQSAAEKGNAAAATQYTDRVLAAVTRASDVTRRALQYVRNAPAQPEVIQLNSALQDARTILSSTAPFLDWYIDSRLADTYIIADSTGLLQVLLNLVRNAVEAGGTPHGIKFRFQKVKLDTQEALTRSVAAGDYVLLTVMDNGPGISESVRDSLFDPLVTTKAGGRGTGLGLPVSKGLTERWGGTLYLASTGENGTSFAALIPIAREQGR